MGVGGDWDRGYGNVDLFGIIYLRNGDREN